MSVFHENMLIGSSGQGAPAATGISRSVRFNSSDSAYLSRTPASAGNRRTWTWAGWVKRTVGSSDDELFSSDSSDGFVIRFVGSTSAIRVYSNSGGGLQLNLITSAVYRDPSAWYHLVVAIDTTQATAANRAKIYVNGVEVTAFSTSAYPSQNTDLLANQAIAHYIGKNAWGVSGLNAYLADIYFIDGQALTPSSFTETDATTGQLIPKAFTGSCGTNGFHLEFADNSAATAAALGKDTSGNGLNWTPNNLSVTAGAGNDSLVDVPTNGAQTDTGAGGEVRGNYCTWNPLSGSLGTRTLSNGNLDTSNSANGNTYSTFELSSGKWYFEATLTAISGSAAATFLGLTASSGNRNGDNAQNLTPNVAYCADGTKIIDAASTSYGATYTTNDVIGVAVDLDAGSITFYKNGSSQGSISKTFAGAGKGSWAIFTVAASSSASNSWSLNAGARSFAYTAPSGFKALCTANLPAPLVTKPSTVFDIVLRTGTGAGGGTISSLNFSADLIWSKLRSSTSSHYLVDTVRGIANSLVTNTTGSELSYPNWFTSITSTGYTVGDLDWQSGSSVVEWAWDAGSTTVTNTQGSITGGSQVRANATAGFSIVTYTGNGTSGATVGHGLSVAPSLILVKCRSNAAGWLVYHRSLGATQYLALESTAAAGTYSGAWNNTSPTSTVFSVGNDSSVNASSRTYVAYVFSPVVGYSSFGSYTGNGSSTDGPFVYTGFRPRWILVKRTDVADDWPLMDTARTPSNPQNLQLWPNFSNAESTITNRAWDALSNGFKLRGDNFATNASGGTYIYAAFAETPFNYARAR
jgi:Concanavalin A-like lectin/glucanases superfamily/SPRY domain